jgi:hypothetical protein
MGERERIDEVEVASREEVLAAVREALTRLNLNRNQLEEQARQGRFTSEQARLIWSAIREVASPA